MMTLDEMEVIQRSMFNGTYEPEESQWVRDTLQSGQVFLDIGASFGWYTTLALGLVGPDGKVFAYEPGSKAYQSLSYNLKDIANLNIKNIAAGKTSGHISLYEPMENQIYTPSCFSQPFGTFQKTFVPVDLIDNDPDINQCEAIDLVKLDIEGSEPDALWGMKTLITQGKVKRIICEYNEFWLKQNNYTYSKMIQDFYELGFLIEKVSTIINMSVTIDNNQILSQKLQSLMFKHRSTP